MNLLIFLKREVENEIKSARRRHLEVYIFLLSIRSEAVTQAKDRCWGKDNKLVLEFMIKEWGAKSRKTEIYSGKMRCRCLSAKTV